MPLNDLGILGGGQLAGMLAEAAARLGLVTSVCADAPVPAAAKGNVVHQRADSPVGIRALAESCAVITCESENIPASLLLAAETICAVRPSSEAQGIAQDRLLEKQQLRALGIPTADFQAVASADDVAAACIAAGGACLLKTRRGGYDGYGQVMVTHPFQAAAAWQAIGEQPAIAEHLVPFSEECAQIAARGVDGEVVFYPLVHTVHQRGILRWAKVRPADPHLADEARTLVTRLLESLDYIGVMTVEFFVVGQRLIANEIAPRVHNSGHWTIEGAETSQFENHVRAVCGLPLGATTLRQPSALVNCLGLMPDTSQIQAIPGTTVHNYGKQPRAGRKVGHVTVVADDDATLHLRLHQVIACLHAQE